MKMPYSPRRRAYTQIELFVVIAILCILFAVAVPAIQKVRTIAQRVQCANNMQLVGMAAIQYHQNNRRFPAACVMPYAKPAATPSIMDASILPPPIVINDTNARLNSDPNNPFGPNWAVFLLPYLEQTALYNQARPDDYLTGYRAHNTTLRDRWRTIVRSVSVPRYLCPADTGTHNPFDGYTNAPGPWARGNYAVNAGPGWWQTSLDGGSYAESYGKTGPVMGINFGATLGRIPDGSATTVMLNEVRSGTGRKDPRGVWAMGFPGASVTAANAIGDCTTPNDRNDQSDDVEGCPEFWHQGIGSRDCMGCGTGLLNLGWPSWQAQARSLHPGGVNVCFADGSVRFVSDYVSQGVWFSMLSTSDGNGYALDD